MQMDVENSSARYAQSVNPFGTRDMAIGYARSRPPVHRLVLAAALTELHPPTTFTTCLDIGCGSGLSLRALEGIAARRVGLEPALAMCACVPEVAPNTAVLCSTAEKLPFAGKSIDLLTAAGSLNYVDLHAFFPEAIRVLSPSTGVLLVYDFAPGNRFADGRPDLSLWFAEFQRRYAPPSGEAQVLNPAILANLAAPAFRLAAGREFSVTHPLTRDAYLDYMLTETNVAAAVRRGEPLAAIRQWCDSSLRTFWTSDSAEPIAFGAWFAWLRDPAQPVPDNPDRSLP